MASSSGHGLALIFQAMGPKRSFDKSYWPIIGFLVIIHSILGPSLKI